MPATQLAQNQLNVRLNRGATAFAAGTSYDVDARSFGVLRTNSAAANASLLQAGIDGVSNYGGTIGVREMYPCDPLTLRRGVSLVGSQLASFKGPFPRAGATPALSADPSGGGFLITNTALPFITFSGANAVHGLAFVYPSQIYTASTVAATISYPSTISRPTAAILQSVSVSRCVFIGCSSAIDLQGTTTYPLQDVSIDLCYGYPFGGALVAVSNCYDKLHLNGNHVNPGVGINLFGDVSGSVGLGVTTALVGNVVSTGTTSFYFDAVDELAHADNFAFGVGVGFRVNNCYGSMSLCETDCVNVGLWYTPGASHKALTILGGCHIPSAGSTGTRTAVKYDGAAGFLKLIAVHSFAGTNAAVPGSSGVANSFLQVSGSGAQRTDVIACSVGQGSYANFVNSTNGSAVTNLVASP